MDFNKLSGVDAQMFATMATLSLPLATIREIQNAHLDTPDSAGPSSGSRESSCGLESIRSTRGLIAALLTTAGLGIAAPDIANAAPPTPQEIAIMKQNPFAVLFNLRKTLYQMHRFSFEGKFSEQQIKDLLHDLDEWLDEFEKLFPNHPAVQTTRSMLQDLERDFAAKGKDGLRLDTSFDLLMRNFQRDISKSRVRRVKINQASKEAQEIAQRMKLSGVPVTYIVKNKEPSRGIIIFFPQVHNAMNLSSEVNQKFTKFYEEKLHTQVRKLVDAGIVSDVFFEGFDQEITDQMGIQMKQVFVQNPDLPLSPGEKLKMEYGSKIRSIGVDNMDLNRYVFELSNRMVRQMEQDDELIKGGKLTVSEFRQLNDRFRKIVEELTKGMTSRATSHNAVFFLNVDIQMQILSQMFHRNVAAFIFGAAHEVNYKDGNRVLKDGTPHPLPLSSLLADRGFEVLVVEQIAPKEFDRVFSTVLQKIDGKPGALRSDDWIQKRVEKIRREMNKK